MAISPQKSESYVAISNDGTIAAIGPDATLLFAAASIRIGLETYAKFGRKLNRDYTPQNILAFASARTGKKYRKNREDYLRAAADLKVWCLTMSAALPVVEG